METKARNIIKKTREKIKKGARKFPPELKLHMVMGKYNVYNKYLRYYKRL